MEESPFTVSQAIWAEAMFGVDIIACAAGTVIRNDDGSELTVDDEHAVSKGRLLYCTQAHYDALKAHVPQKPQTPFQGIADIMASRQAP